MFQCVKIFIDSSIIGVSFAKKIAKIVAEFRPDIVVNTGDFLDRGIREPEKIVKIFRDLEAPLGKYAVYGNHEYYVGRDRSKKFVEAAGFMMLKNRIWPVTNYFSVIGFDDRTAERFGISSKYDEASLLKTISKEKFSLVLKHQPLFDKESVGHFDLQLSGHTHAGQIFPFTLFVKLAYHYLKGYYSIGKGSFIHVNRGTGTWGPPIRLFAPPEVTLIQVKRK